MYLCPNATLLAGATKVEIGERLYPMFKKVNNGFLYVRHFIGELDAYGYVDVCHIYKEHEEHGYVLLTGLPHDEYQNLSWCATLSDFSITMSCGCERDFIQWNPVVESAVHGAPIKNETNDAAWKARDWESYDYFALEVGLLTTPDQHFRTVDSHHITLAYWPKSNNETARKMHEAIDTVLKGYQRLSYNHEDRPLELPNYRSLDVNVEHIDWGTSNEQRDHNAYSVIFQVHDNADLLRRMKDGLHGCSSNADNP